MNPLDWPFTAFSFFCYVLLAFTLTMTAIAIGLYIQSGGHGPGGDDFDVVLPPDPGGLTVDWDAELQALLSIPKGTK